MKRSVAVNLAVFIIVLSIAPLSLLSCEKEQPVERIDLPPTPVLTLSSDWAVIRSPFLRLREEPLQKAKIVAHLRRGSVLEIITRTEAKETIDNVASYWYGEFRGVAGMGFRRFPRGVGFQVQGRDLCRGARVASVLWISASSGIFS